ncbi:MAG: prepilin-type N-terminal cleavage/methylation domain-containing protein [Vallitaleaceae bacterium]|nr:prepilin-type N-terminal cleavage/methylation domain-containing protein [Vallitaleaceae bacterium]
MKTSIFKKNQSGFTVVELMTAIVIAGIITGVIGTFLLVHIKSFETTKDIVDIQYDTQLAMNSLNKTILEGKRAFIVKEDPLVVGQGIVDTTISGISTPFCIGFVNKDNSVILFQYHATNKMIYFSQYSAYSTTYATDLSSGSWYEFISNVEQWSFETIPSNTLFDQADALQISLSLNKNGAIIDLSNTFKFRNKE